MTTDLFSGIFSRAKAALGARPASVPIATPVPVMVVPAYRPAPAGTHIPLGPKPADVQDIPTQYRFQMQTVKVGAHSTAETAIGTSNFVDGK